MRQPREPDRFRLIVDEVRSSVAAIIGVASEDVDDDVEFPALGMDSLMATELRNTLQRSLGSTLDATVAFEHPTVTELAGYLVQEVVGEAGGRTEPPPTAPSAPQAELDLLFSMSDDEVANQLLRELEASGY